MNFSHFPGQSTNRINIWSASDQAQDIQSDWIAFTGKSGLKLNFFQFQVGVVYIPVHIN